MVIDPNLVVPTKLAVEDVQFYSVLQPPLGLYGVYYDNGLFRRMPEAVAETVNPGVHRLHAHTAGGRVRFRTDSPYIAVSVRLGVTNLYPHFSTVGSAGMDLYVEDENRCLRAIVPPRDPGEHYEGLVETKLEGLHSYVLHLPSYSQVASLHIGIKEGCRLLPPEPYPCRKKVVFYGSSITQGGCSSRPGLSYQNIFARRFGVDYVNLGFSGNAKAEQEMADYVAGLDMDVFVYDYDHNAPTPEFLKQTHENMFITVRKKHPHIPIVLMGRPRHYVNLETQRRLEVLRTTLQNARAAGDNNVYLLEGPELMAQCGQEGLIDSVHPNDLGFMSMATALGDLCEREGLLL